MANDISAGTLGGVVVPARANPAANVQNIPAAGSAEPKRALRQVEKPSALDEVVSGLNEMVQNLHRNLHFSVDNESGETIIKVVDSETEEVVRQIPSEEIVRLRQHLKEASGALFQGAV